MVEIEKPVEIMYVLCLVVDELIHRSPEPPKQASYIEEFTKKILNTPDPPLQPTIKTPSTPPPTKTPSKNTQKPHDNINNNAKDNIKKSEDIIKKGDTQVVVRSRWNHIFNAMKRWVNKWASLLWKAVLAPEKKKR